MKSKICTWLYESKELLQSVSVATRHSTSMRPSSPTELENWQNAV